MRRKQLLKLVAFVCGLYFVLEFLLPEKIGGGFDSYRIGGLDVVASDPKPADDGDAYTLFYAGYYRAEDSAIGMAGGDDGPTRTRTATRPVLQRGLFTGWDQRGLREPRCAAGPAGLFLVYRGIDPEQRETLCAAARTDAGDWRKLGPLRMGTAAETTNAGFQPATPQEATSQPAVACFTIAADADGYAGFFALRRPDGSTPLVRGRSADGTEWSLEMEPVLPSITEDGATHAWRSIDLVRTDPVLIVALDDAGVLYRIGQDDNGASRTEPIEASSILGTPVSVSAVYDGADIRLWWTEELTPATPRPPETYRRETVVASGRIASDESRLLADGPLFSTGAPAQPTYLSRGTEPAGQFLQVVSAFALGLAILNLGIFHGRTLVRRGKGFRNSVAFFLFFVLMTLFAWYGRPLPDESSSPWKLGFDFLFYHVQFAMGAAVFSTVAFYMVSAAFRAFKVKSTEAALMMVSAMIVMIGQVPLGESLANLLPSWCRWLGPPTVSDKILTVVTAAAYRGVLIGTIIGGIAMALRVWLGLEESMYEGTGS